VNGLWISFLEEHIFNIRRCEDGSLACPRRYSWSNAANARFATKGKEDILTKMTEAKYSTGIFTGGKEADTFCTWNILFYLILFHLHAFFQQTFGVPQSLSLNHHLSTGSSYMCNCNLRYAHAGCLFFARVLQLTAIIFLSSVTDWICGTLFLFLVPLSRLWGGILEISINICHSDSYRFSLQPINFIHRTCRLSRSRCCP
jgi:hypothetical protein